MKKVCWLLILVLVIGCFVGCQDAPPAQMLSLQTKKAIENAWDTKTMGPFPGWYDKEGNHPYGLVYYCTISGYTILMRETGTSFGPYSEIRIANYEFKSGDIFHLCAYKNGEFMQLEDAYNKGLISQEDILVIFEAHKAYVCEAFSELAKNWGYDK